MEELRSMDQLAEPVFANQGQSLKDSCDGGAMNRIKHSTSPLQPFGADMDLQLSIRIALLRT